MKCPTCKGKGTQTLHGQAFTADDIDEQGPEFLEDILSGVYDHPCDDCGGSGNVDEEEYYDAKQEQRTMMMESGIWPY